MICHVFLYISSINFINILFLLIKNIFLDRPSTWVHTPSVTENCEIKYCNISTILLRVCIAVTIHKYQGSNIGPNKIFEHEVIHLPSDTMKKTPGIELVNLPI